MNISHVMDKGSIVITGTSRGIGYHLALRFLSEGYGVIGVSRTPSPIVNDKYSDFNVDISSVSDVSALADQLSGRGIVGLINNAGIHGPVGPFEDVSIDAWVQALNVNLIGAVTISKVCLPFIRESHGFIIFLSGGGSAFPRPNYSAYGVSKCGVIRLAEVMAKELSPTVSVYCIAPGPNRTELLVETVQNGEIVREEDIVDFSDPEDLCLFLAQNKDPRYSGKFIHVRDNYHAWGDAELSDPSYTLRRIDPRTLSQVQSL